MRFLDNMKIAQKIISLLVFLGLITAVIAYLGASSVTHTNTSYTNLAEHDLQVPALLTRVNRRAVTMDLIAYQAMIYDASTPTAKAAASKQEESYKAALDYLRQAKETLPRYTAEFSQFEDRLNQMHALTDKATKLGALNKNAEAAALLRPADEMLEPLAKDISAFNDRLIADGKKQTAQLNANAGSTTMTLTIVSILGIAMGIGLSLVVARKGITGPLARLQQTMATLAAGNNSVEIPFADRTDEIGTMADTVRVFRDAALELEAAQMAKAQEDATQQMVVATVGENLGALAAGDLTATINTDFPGNYAELKTNFNAATAALRGLIGGVVESTSAIGTGSNEIAQASEDLARRTEGNAASLEETSAAITQIDGRLKASADAAGRTVARADGAIATVSGGREIADEAVQAMGRVSESAKGIDSVIEGLDKIAFQTRVLAMNAAVEAGRAGDAGRGFAVVADLVSALAMRAEEEAKRARDQLTVTQSEILSAVGAVQKVDGALVNIAGDVGEVHKLLGDMAADNQAQAAAISQISVAVGSMDRATQQNAAMVEQTSAAARNLTTEVSSLSQQTARFDIGGNTAARPVARPAAKPRAAAPARKEKAPAYTSPVKALESVNGEDWASF
jgi:methyl-accepting chemotaxis protein